jgi:uncharacterized membrane protein
MHFERLDDDCPGAAIVYCDRRANSHADVLLHSTPYAIDARWNHVRTIAAMVAAAMLTLALASDITKGGQS